MKRNYIIIALSLLLSVVALKAQIPGNLDSTFNSVGFVTQQPASSYSNSPTYCKVGADGKVVFALSVHTPSNLCDVHLYRYTTTGAIDNTFGTNGHAIIATADTNEWVRDLIILDNGDMLLAVCQSFENNGFPVYGYGGVIKVKANGTRDQSFGVHGMIYEYYFPMWPENIQLSSTGKILLLGSNINGGHTIGVARFNANGTKDTSFGDINGSCIADINVAIGIDKTAQNMLVLPDDKIIVTGYAQYQSPSYANKLFMVMLNSGGDPVTSFSGDGYSDIDILVNTPQTSSFDAGFDLAYQNGKILVAGGTWYNPQSKIFVARYNLNGVIDSTFGTNGMWTYTTTISDVTLLNYDRVKMCVQSDGLIDISFRLGYDIAVMQITANGATSNAFGTNGAAIINTVAPNFPFPNEQMHVFGMDLDSDNRIYVSGDYTNKTFAARINPYPAVPVGVGVNENTADIAAINAFPNPTDGLIRYNYELKKGSQTTIRLYNNTGQLVDVICNNKMQAPGNYSNTVDLTPYASGLYSLVITTGTEQKVIKIAKR